MFQTITRASPVPVQCLHLSKIHRSENGTAFDLAWLAGQGSSSRNFNQRFLYNLRKNTNQTVPQRTFVDHHGEAEETGVELSKLEFCSQMFCRAGPKKSGTVLCRTVLFKRILMFQKKQEYKTSIIFNRTLGLCTKFAPKWPTPCPFLEWLPRIAWFCV